MSQYNISDPQQWAVAQLGFMGLPQTPQNVDFLVSWAAMEGGNWHNTAYYNPLNTTLQMPGANPMNSVGVEAYTTWQQGIQATADTIQGGYPEIVAALQSGNPWGANMAQDLSKWSGGGYTAVSSNSGYGNTQGGPSGSISAQGNQQPGMQATLQGNQGGQPPPPPLTDPTALANYINLYYPGYAWLLTVPGVSDTLEQAVEQQLSSAQIQALIQGTSWWRTTSDAMRQYEETQAQYPAELSFSTNGSQAQQVLAQVMSLAAQNGVQLTGQQAQLLATDYMKYGWNSTQLQSAIGELVSFNGQGGNAMSVVDQIKAMAANYYQNPSSAAVQSWAQNIAAGTQTIQEFQAQMQQDAAMKWTGYAPQLKAGNNMVQLTDGLRNNISQLMEVSPESINFTTDPTYSKILDYVAPGDKTGVHRVMTQSEADQYLRNTPQWGVTQQARDQGAQLEQALIQTFGKIG